VCPSFRPDFTLLAEKPEAAAELPLQTIRNCRSNFDLWLRESGHFFCAHHKWDVTKRAPLTREIAEGLPTVEAFAVKAPRRRPSSAFGPHLQPLNSHRMVAPCFRFSRALLSGSLHENPKGRKKATARGRDTLACVLPSRLKKGASNGSASGVVVHLRWQVASARHQRF
jgi:hypothetical protein